jgi:hypothetical protein
MSFYRSVLGSFRILRRRAVAVGQPALRVWANTGESAAMQLSRQVLDASHRAETRALSLEQQIREMTADGKIDREEFKQLLAAVGRAHHIAEDCHDIGETVS